MYNTQIQGIDIAGWQTRIDWDKAKAIPELRFVFVKATQGVNYVDPMFRSHRAGAIRAGKDVGLTHFLDFFNYIIGQEEAFGRRQADFFHATTKDNPGQAGYLLDTETNEGANWPKITIFNIGRILKIALAFHIRMKELGRKFGGSYNTQWVAESMKNFTEGYFFGPRYKLVKAMNDIILFNSQKIPAGSLYQPEISRFLTAGELATYPEPTSGAFPKATFRQYSSRLKGTILGFNGYIDADVFNGTEEEYSALLGNTCIPTVPVVEEDAPVPLQSFAGKDATVINAVNVRNGVGTGSPQWTINGTPFVILKDTVLDIHESAYDSAGNPWLRIGYKEWVCAEFNGSKLLSIS